jgi:hypothetical protein
MGEGRPRCCGLPLPLPLAWIFSMRSMPGYTTAIGTGPTYAVKEGDETYSIEVIATATNDNGVIPGRR